jgi:hypothetical protein
MKKFFLQREGCRSVETEKLCRATAKKGEYSFFNVATATF